jgi:uncharacterized protein (DUF3820 family)
MLKNWKNILKNKYKSYVANDKGIKFLFGKYKNCYLHDIDDSEYLKWIINEFVEKNNFDEDLIVEIEQELKVRGITF